MLQNMETLHQKVKPFLDERCKKWQLLSMTPRDTARLELRAEMFKALAHPMRLLILEKLKERSYCVCELAAEVGIEKSVASKHLAQLREAGLIEDEKRGTVVHYRLIAPCVLDMGRCVEETIIAQRKRELGIKVKQA
jgi:ArsR family transcriptional regulator